MEEDYYYDDEGYDEYYDNAADEVADVDPLEVKYIDGKGYMQNNIEESLRCLKEVLEEDGARGRWTFKALKMLCRASRMAKHYDDMTTYYAQVVSFSHPDITHAAVAKAMLKFSEESKRVPGQWRGRALQMTLDAALADTEKFHSVLVPTLLQRATLLLEEHRYSEALADLEMAFRHCGLRDGSAAATSVAQLNATSVYQIYALQLQAYRRLRRYGELRRTYHALSQVQAALPPLRMTGGVLESAGHLFLHDGDWAAAHRAFTASLRCYTECGDAQQYVVAKYVVLATMMADLPVDLFAQDDALAEHPYVRPVRALWRAYAAGDVAAFLETLGDPENVACFANDVEFAPYTAAATQQLRVKYLVAYTKSFATVSLTDLCRRLHMEEQPCRELCVSAILHGHIKGHLDDGRRMLVITTSGKQGVAPCDAPKTLRSFAALTNELCCQCVNY